MLTPSTLDELASAVRAAPRVLAVGARTKSRLSAVGDTLVSTRDLRGITEYEPSEFTFTALAGTPLREIDEALREKGQHLPFEPMLVDAGATLGGTVAAGLNGPGRLRFGGLRDFILGVRFVDGAGRLLRMGGKVVKNVAGFDLPKFFVGSFGRFGVLGEITFKVFPRPASTLTLELPAADPEAAVRMLAEIPLSRWEPHALEYEPSTRMMHLRLGGPGAALETTGAEILGRWSGRALPAEEAAAFWRSLREFAWTHPDGTLLKVATTARVLLQIDSLARAVEGARMRLGAAGDVLFVSLPHGADGNALGRVLRGLDLPAVTLRGEGPLFPGAVHRSPVEERVKAALDPEGRFPPLDEGGTPDEADS